MTIRLVALMSVVLLVSLAAFALLGSHYQDQVMDELAQTVSTTGRETLRALDLGLTPHWVFESGHPGSGHADGAHRVPEEGGVEHMEGVAIDARAMMTFESEGEGDVLIIRREIGTREHGVLLSRGEVERVVLDGAVAGQLVDCDRVEAETNGVEVTCEERTEGTPGSPGGQIVTTRMIRLADVRAESDPAQGIVLSIPTRTTDETGEPHRDTNAFSYSWHSEPDASGGEDGDDGAAAAPVASGSGTLQEFRLPIPTTEYQSLFDRARKGSLALFFGVLVVGTMLSAGLATRFTRPIRRLDAGIRRLSAGDLDVVVDTSGPPEVGRVGRAFNDMARSLRAAREREREIGRREKLSALGRLAAGVAHDVRNPLHSIGLTLQNIQEACRPEDRARASDFDRSVGVIREEIRRLDSLVGGFLQFARSDERAAEPVDLGALLRETARLVEHEAGRRGVEITVEVDEAVPPVTARAESIRSSVLNLVLNSFEAVPGGGRVALRLRAGRSEALIEVEDDGRGIPEEDRERVFEFAFTTRDGGHGLGLPMVHKVVVEDHGGRVTLHGREGEGTRIVMALPLDRDTAGESPS